MDITKEIREIINDQLGASQELITEEKNIMDDLGADSLDRVEIVMALEEKFKIEISDEAAEELKTVGDIIKYVGLSVK